MVWNWQLPDWPHFTYDPSRLVDLERRFLLSIGKGAAYLKTVGDEDYQRFLVEILSSEGLESSRIEGEILDRESLQSSIQRQFGMASKIKKGAEKEWRMAQLLHTVYDTFDEPLSDEMLCHWHAILFDGSLTIETRGGYRTHEDPMQIVSNRSDSQKVFFEAPPSKLVPVEMKKYIHWFNSTQRSPSVLGRAALAHVYFESIHPFEDGNGRIGRVLSEKVLAQDIGRPLYRNNLKNRFLSASGLPQDFRSHSRLGHRQWLLAPNKNSEDPPCQIPDSSSCFGILIAISKRLERRKKEYYAELERCNRTLVVDQWVEFFAEVIFEAHEESMALLTFLIEKTKMLQKLSDQINPRQLKVLLRMFEEGPAGFKGGLSAENYVTIAKTTRATATRDLNDLVKKGALLKSGQLRHTRYQLNWVSPSY